METFPKLEKRCITIRGIGWNKSASDIIVSSLGWVAVTAGRGTALDIAIHTPLGKGIHLRIPSLFPDAVNSRGRRSQRDSSRSFLGHL